VRARKLPAVLLGLVAGALVIEVGLRVMLFAELGPLGLRRPWLYCHRYENDYWTLQQRWRNDPGPVPEGLFDAELGWLPMYVERGTMRHKEVRDLCGRRPVLLYGDSYARCNTGREDCFETLLAQSDLGAQLALLNYGVRGYGLDQAWLLLDRSLDAHLEDDPIVVVGIYLDEDLDRSLLDIRGWPKPRMRVSDGELVRPAAPIAPLAEYLDEHPARIPSYALRYLVYGSGLAPDALRSWWSDAGARRREGVALTRALLDAIRARLEAQNVTWFVLLFHGEPRIHAGEPPDWREDCVLDWLRESGVPHVSSRLALEADGRERGDYYGDYGQLREHLNPLGNRIVFGALRRGVEGDYD
jgi:hypothetical protein